VLGEAISDAQVVGVLRPFVRVAGPLVDSLRESDPFGLRERLLDRPEEPPQAEDGGGSENLRERLLDMLAGVHAPGTSAWARMDTGERSAWWVSRVGRFVALLASVPGIGGALADRLPVTDTLGAAGQGLLLCAIAGEHGITDVPTRVRLLASVLFARKVSAELAAGERPEEERRIEELAEDMNASRRSKGRVTLKAAARTVWKLGKALWSVSDELEKRPRGRFYHHALGMLPVVGMLGDYLGERSGLKRAAKAATKWIEQTAAEREWRDGGQA
jgi:hypothetical protein